MTPLRSTLMLGALLTMVPWAAAQEFLGKNVLAWAQELDRPEESARRNAAYALGKLASHAAPAVPALAKLLAGDASAKVREAAAFALGEIGVVAAADPNVVPALVGALKNKDALVRRSAAYALGSLGSYAGEARGPLQTALGDSRPEVRQNAAWALGKIGGAAVASLRQALGDADSLVKRDAAAALAPLDPTLSRPALAELLPLCSDANSEVRKAALIVLVKIVRPDDTTALGPIREALGDQDFEIRTNAALALSNIGVKGATGAVPVLLDALRRGDLELRRQAAVALGKFGSGAKDAVPELVSALRDPDGDVQANAAFALGGIGPDAASAVPVLVQIITERKEKTMTRAEAAGALSLIGAVPAAVEAVPTLLAILQDPTHDDKVRERIVWALRVHETKLRTLPDIYPTFTKVLSEPGRDTNRLLRYTCAYFLGVLQGADAGPTTLNVLLEFLKDDTIEVFENKTSSVGGTGQETASGKANVKEVGKGDGRIMATRALTQIGPVRLAERKDILRQLQFLASDQATLPELKEACKKLLQGVN